ncbi:MAG: hypothetical protein QM676_13855 [Novosphingobium sp.]
MGSSETYDVVMAGSGTGHGGAAARRIGASTEQGWWIPAMTLPGAWWD